MYLFTMLAFNIGQPWRKVVFTNVFFMIVFVVIILYSSLIVMVPDTRIPDFFLSYMYDEGLNGFVLGMGFAFGLFIYFMQKAVWEPAAIWLRKTFPDKAWL
jgi:hypothetical protein